MSLTRPVVTATDVANIATSGDCTACPTLEIVRVVERSNIDYCKSDCVSEFICAPYNWIAMSYCDEYSPVDTVDVIVVVVVSALVMVVVVVVAVVEVVVTVVAGATIKRMHKQGGCTDEWTD